MSLHEDLDDLWRSAPAEHRDALDNTCAAVLAKDWDRADILIQTVPVEAATTWHERIAQARSQIEQRFTDDDEEDGPGCVDDDDDDDGEHGMTHVGLAIDRRSPLYLAKDCCSYVPNHYFTALWMRTCFMGPAKPDPATLAANLESTTDAQH